MDTVLNWVWQGSAVGLTALVLLRALARARANVRYAVCWAGLLAIMLLPLVPMLTARSVPVAAPGAGEAAFVLLPADWWTSSLFIAAAWAVWASVQCVRFLLAIVAIRRARATSRPFPLDLELTLPHWRQLQRTGRRARLVVSDAVASAAVLSWGHPRIAVAPRLVHTLTTEDLDRILVHEWAHVQRRDDLVNLLQIVVRVIAGWHPAAWLLDRRLQVEREIACDETTVAITGSPKSYARCLVRLADRPPQQTLSMAPAMLMPSDLQARVVSILSSRQTLTPVWARSLAAAIVVVLGLVCTQVSGVKVVDAAAMTLPFAAPPAMATSTEHRFPRMTLAESTPIASPAAVSRVSAEAGTVRRRTAQAASVQPVPANGEAVPAAPLSVARESDRGPDTARPARNPNIESSILPGGERPAAGDTPRAEAMEPVAPLHATQNIPDGIAESPVSSPATVGAQSPWGAAAAGGAAIGQKSRDAGVATAGFFSRVAKRVAGSF